MSSRRSRRAARSRPAARATPERARRRRHRQHRWSGRCRLTGSTGRERLVGASLVVGRHDGRRDVVKRYRLIAAVGAVAMFTAVLGGSSAYGGSSGSRPGEPDQDRRAHAAHGELRALGAPGARRGGACRERDQQVGRRQGARAGAQAQPRRRGRPVHEHDRGHRRLQAADPAGGRRLGRGHHRQPDRAGDHAARRGRRRCRCSS